MLDTLGTTLAANTLGVGCPELVRVVRDAGGAPQATLLGLGGKVPAVIHVSPEAAMGGPLAKVVDGDIIRLDAPAGTLQVMVSAAEWDARPVATMPEALRQSNSMGMGRELFAGMRRNALAAEEGACSWL